MNKPKDFDVSKIFSKDSKNTIASIAVIAALLGPPLLSLACSLGPEVSVPPTPVATSVATKEPTNEQKDSFSITDPNTVSIALGLTPKGFEWSEAAREAIMKHGLIAAKVAVPVEVAGKDPTGWYRVNGLGDPKKWSTDLYAVLYQPGSRSFLKIALNKDNADQLKVDEMGTKTAFSLIEETPDVSLTRVKLETKEYDALSLTEFGETLQAKLYDLVMKRGTASEAEVRGIAQQAWVLYYRMFAEKGIFGPDPNWGNIVVLPNGKVAMFDWENARRVPYDENSLALLWALYKGKTPPSIYGSSILGIDDPYAFLKNSLGSGFRLPNKSELTVFETIGKTPAAIDVLTTKALPREILAPSGASYRASDLIIDGIFTARTESVAPMQSLQLKRYIQKAGRAIIPVFSDVLDAGNVIFWTSEVEKLVKPEYRDEITAEVPMGVDLSKVQRRDKNGQPIRLIFMSPKVQELEKELTLDGLFQYLWDSKMMNSKNLLLISQELTDWIRQELPHFKELYAAAPQDFLKNVIDDYQKNFQDQIMSDSVIGSKWFALTTSPNNYLFQSQPPVFFGTRGEKDTAGNFLWKEIVIWKTETVQGKQIPVVLAILRNDGQKWANRTIPIAYFEVITNQIVGEKKIKLVIGGVPDQNPNQLDIYIGDKEK